MSHRRTGWTFKETAPPEKMRIRETSFSNDPQTSGNRLNILRWPRLDDIVAVDTCNTPESNGLVPDEMPGQFPVAQNESQNVMNDLPSRQMDVLDTSGSGDGRNGTSTHNRRSKFATMRIRKAAMTRNRDCLDQNELIENISVDPLLNQLSPESEQKRLEAIRDLHCSLTMKRQLKTKVSTRIENNKKPIRGPSMKFRVTRCINVTKRKMKEGFRKLDLWENSLKVIEGRFGCSNGYYFRFLQRLVYLNLLIFLISGSFILVPQLLWNSCSTCQTFSEPDDENIPIPMEQKLQYTNDMMPNNSMSNHSNVAKVLNDSYFEWEDILTGSGYLSKSALYYGGYVNHSITLSHKNHYYLPLAYLLAIAIYLLICLFLLAKWVGNAYKKYIASTSGYGEHTFCNLLFCSWDFAITCKATGLSKQNGIRKELKERLLPMKTTKVKLTCYERMGQILKFIIFQLITISILSTSGATAWLILDSNALKYLQESLYRCVVMWKRQPAPRRRYINTVSSIEPKV